MSKNTGTFLQKMHTNYIANINGRSGVITLCGVSYCAAYRSITHEHLLLMQYSKVYDYENFMTDRMQQDKSLW